MKILTKKRLEKYYNPQASCQVLGCIMKKPSLMKLTNYQLDIEDFLGDRHRTLFFSIHNLMIQGLQEIKISDIETYLSVNDPKGYVLLFENEQNLEWIDNILEDSNEVNFEYYYTIIRKMALLRNYMKEGTDVTCLLDLDEIDPVIIRDQQEKFELKSLIDIQRFFDKKNTIAKERFFMRDGGASRKSGENADELRQRLKENPCYGFGLESQYLNTITRGALGGKFFIETRDSGLGKTRNAIKRLVAICSPYVWDFDKNEYVPNRNGQGNSGLYIGTEMDVYEELEPMIWAFISGVEEHKIRKGITTDEEDIRVDKAIEIAKEMELYLEDEEDYDVQFIENMVEKYKTDHNISALVIDYLELTASLISEYSQLTKGMSVREDQVLLNLSAKVKNIAKRYQITIFGYTQTTDEARRDGVRDQRAVKGARSLPNKADVGMVVFEPTKKELELVEPYIQKTKGLGKNIVPNIIYTIYKNRGGELKSIKIWGYQNLGNMRVIDLFCTNNYYELISVDKTEVNFIDE